MQQTKNISGSITTIVWRGLLVSLATILLTVSIPAERPIALAADSSAQVQEPDSLQELADQANVVNNGNSDNGGSAAADSRVNNTDKKTGWSDIRYLRDANNVTMVDYKNLFGMHIGKVYNPNFVDDADWFLSHFEDHGDYYLVPYNYDWHFYSDISAPWYGCEAQSRAMIVTINEYKATGEQKYLEFSQKILDGFNSPILNQNGWFLGVAAKNNDAAILNSQLYCVIALQAYYEDTGNEKALSLFDTGLDVLEKNIDNLTAHCGTYYSLSKDRFVLHQQHPEYIGLLSKLYSITGSVTLKKTLDTWQHDYLTCKVSSSK